MRILRDNGLRIVLVLMTILSLVGMALAGLSAENATLSSHGAAPIDLTSYLVSGSFLGAMFENWESEFLQMTAYVVLTAFLWTKIRRHSERTSVPLHPYARVVWLSRSIPIR